MDLIVNKFNLKSQMAKVWDAKFWITMDLNKFNTSMWMWHAYNFLFRSSYCNDRLLITRQVEQGQHKMRFKEACTWNTSPNVTHWAATSCQDLEQNGCGGSAGIQTAGGDRQSAREKCYSVNERTSTERYWEQHIAAQHRLAKPTWCLLHRQVAGHRLTETCINDDT